MTVHTWIRVENCPVFCNTPDKKKEDASRGKLCKGKGGKRVMEVIYNQNDNQLQSRQWQRQRERNARRQLEKGGLGDEAEIGEGLWATGRLFLPLASGWSSLSCGSVGEGLCYQPDRETSETATAVAPRSKLVLRVGNFKEEGLQIMMKPMMKTMID